MKKTIEPGRYMWATTAIHQLGDISRPKGDLCIVHEETEIDYIGNWITGFGFMGVRFPKETTRELTAEEKADWNGRSVGIEGSWSYEIELGKPTLAADAPVAELENWSLVSAGYGLSAPELNGRPKLHGFIKGHPRLPDGESITTSRVIGKRGDLVATRNTLYRLGTPDRDYEEAYPDAKSRVLNALEEV